MVLALLDRADGAAFNSHGRKAVEKKGDVRSRPEGPTFPETNLRPDVAPSALNPYFSLHHGLTTVAIQ